MRSPLMRSLLIRSLPMRSLLLRAVMRLCLGRPQQGALRAGTSADSAGRSHATCGGSCRCGAVRRSPGARGCTAGGRSGEGFLGPPHLPEQAGLAAAGLPRRRGPPSHIPRGTAARHSIVRRCAWTGRTPPRLAARPIPHPSGSTHVPASSRLPGKPAKTEIIGRNGRVVCQTALSERTKGRSSHHAGNL